jgi:hypothetical protein
MRIFRRRWCMDYKQKCATILGGKVQITFEEDRTVCWFQALSMKLGTSPPLDVDEF